MVANFNLGDGLTLICALFFALYILFLDIESSKHDFWILLFIQILTTAVLSIVFLFIFSIAELEEIKINFTSNLITAILYTSIFATLITTALQTKYQKNVTPAKAGIIFSFEPIFAAIFAFFILGEKITNFGYLGAALIMLGLLVSELYENFILKMTENRSRANITVHGLVQGVGFRYFVVRKAKELKLNGYVKNQMDGTVLTVVEGDQSQI